ncbi:hypothetical protein GW17_00003966 [Ensete ventricosum]|nr:hypothetical protein GW17_00003966 [Ensete ventricosum]
MVRWHRIVIVLLTFKMTDGPTSLKARGPCHSTVPVHELDETNRKFNWRGSGYVIVKDDSLISPRRHRRPFFIRNQKYYYAPPHCKNYLDHQRYDTIISKRAPLAALRGSPMSWNEQFWYFSPAVASPPKREEMGLEKSVGAAVGPGWRCR